MDPKHVELPARVGRPALLCGGSPVLAAAAPDLGTAETFAVLAGP